MPKKSYTPRSREEINEAVNNLFAQIEAGAPKSLNSSNIKEYLDTMSKFHNYSVNNQILIKQQMPNASIIAGAGSWKANFGRYINRGEHALRILAPQTYRVQITTDKLDENGSPILGRDGTPEQETKTVEKIRYVDVPVFDISQTNGKELPEPLKILNDNSREAADLLEATEAISPFSIDFVPKNQDPLLMGGAKGYFSVDDNSITISDNLPLAHKAKTLIHEMAHGVLHNQENDKSKEQKEIEAEAVAYTVCNYFGLDTSDYSFAYIDSWSQGKTPEDLKNILEGIQQETTKLISGIEDIYPNIKEKNKDLPVPEMPEEEPVESEPETSEPEQEEPVETGPEAAEPVEPEPDTSESDTEAAESEPEEPVEPEAEDLDESSETPSPEPSVPVNESTSNKEDGKETKGIQDFGQKIGGARKDLWAGRGLNMDDILEMNDAEMFKYVKKDNVWKKPNYQKEVEEGLPVEVVYFQKMVRAACAPKPVIGRSANTPEKVKACYERYVNAVSELRDAVMQCRDQRDMEDMALWLLRAGYVEKQSFGYYPSEKGYDIATNKLLKALNTPTKDMGSIFRAIKKEQFCYTDRQKALEDYIIVPFKKDSLREYPATSERDNRYAVCNLENTFSYPIVHFKDEFSDINDFKEGKYMVISVSLNEVIGKNFDTRKEAEDFCIEQDKEEPEAPTTTSNRKKSLIPPMLQNIERKGEDFRDGHNATGQDYLDEFGFKGGEFGNWLNENERQQSLNFGYDAFRDLALALNVKPENVSVDGKLNIAFGSRGKGKALAHYEPLRNVINITKMKGAGSLGHEWIHAMDDLVGKQLGFSGMLSDALSRKGVPKSFTELIDTIKSKSTTKEESIDIAQKDLNDGINKFKRIANQYFPEQRMTQKQISQKNAVIEASVKAACGTIKELNPFNHQTSNFDVSSSIAAISQLRKEMFGHGIPLDKQRDMAIWQNMVTKRNKNFVAAKEGTMTYKVSTQFYKDARAIDGNFSKSDKGYWASDCELLARAGACYIKDTLEKMGIRDDYLCGHADTAAIKIDGDLVYTSPQGDERVAINKAFDKFFTELKELDIFQDPEKAFASLDDMIASAESLAERHSNSNKSKDGLEL